MLTHFVLVPSSLQSVGCTGTCVPIGWVKCRKLCWDSCADTLCVSVIFPSVLDAQVLVCLSVGSSVGNSADVNAQVLVYLSVGLKCWKFCGCWMHRYLCTYRLG